ncbi:hypothetical protein IYR97_24250 (plasmid) [Pseudomonas fulva]|uniref:DUF3077 domain-containing protein n=2 Tax=Pseudomonas putida group TaxID=136845 RepID=A0ABD7BMJ3_PSEPU|nr:MULTISPECIES: hypothetical protein [Pseudomonas putida group]QOD01634.1 hypothetical protein ID616_30915 [Pseudomonas putida]QPH46906.1 hypothetical protein IYR97_24250 [Pseudomonas fulva]QPH52081.1 hypothetical protein IZU98_24705 [Pseudomonas fulva]
MNQAQNDHPTSLYFNGGQEPTVLNVFASFSTQAGDLLDLIIAATGFYLTPGQRATAIEHGLQVAQSGEPSAESLAASWAKQKDLVEFASAVRRAFIPV